MPNIKSIKYLTQDELKRLASHARYLPLTVVDLFVGLLQFMIVSAVVEATAQGHVFEPKGKLGRFLLISETARMPLLIGFAIVLSPVTLAYAIKDRLRAKHKDYKILDTR